MTSVNVQRINKQYGSSQVLMDISTHFPEGSFTSLLGPSGSGKTTLLRIIAGFISPDSGSVQIGDADMTRVPVWARNIGMMFQSYALFPHMTVAQNVAFGLKRRGVDAQEIKTRVQKALDTVRMSEFGQRKPAQLSGGQQQRVALARAIVIKPSVLLLDEPLSALDRRLRQEMQVELLRIQRDSGLTTIFVTHDQEEALTLSDQVAILNKGRIVQMGLPADIYEKPETRFAAAFLGDSNFLSGQVDQGRVRLADGASIACAGPLPANGTRVTLAVRPEKILIDDEFKLSDHNTLKARIAQTIYCGPTLTYLVEREGGESFNVLAQNREGRVLPAGSEVFLRWPAAQTVVLSD